MERSSGVGMKGALRRAQSKYLCSGYFKFSITLIRCGTLLVYSSFFTLEANKKMNQYPTTANPSLPFNYHRSWCNFYVHEWHCLLAFKLQIRSFTPELHFHLQSTAEEIQNGLHTRAAFLLTVDLTLFCLPPLSQMSVGAEESKFNLCEITAVPNVPITLLSERSFQSQNQ